MASVGCLFATAAGGILPDVRSMASKATTTSYRKTSLQMVRLQPVVTGMAKSVHYGSSDTPWQIRLCAYKSHACNRAQSLSSNKCSSCYILGFLAMHSCMHGGIARSHEVFPLSWKDIAATLPGMGLHVFHSPCSPGPSWREHHSKKDRCS